MLSDLSAEPLQAGRIVSDQGAVWTLYQEVESTDKRLPRCRYGRRPIYIENYAREVMAITRDPNYPWAAKS